jgi:hypothetical protein
MRIPILKMQKSTLIALALGLVLFALSGFGRNVFAGEKVIICHKGAKTATVAAPAVSAHQQHGDALGSCGSASEPEETMTAVVMMRCDAIPGGTVLVTSASISPVDIIEGGINPRDDCAAVVGELIDDDFGLKSITNGSAEAGDGSLRLYTDYLLLGKVGDDDDDDEDDDD